MDQSSKKTLSSQTKVFTLRNESQETNSFPLALFRILFGLVLTRFFWDMLSGPWISATFENAQVVMKYDLLPWIEASPAQLRLILLVLMSSSIFFTLGLFYRANCFILLFLYSYLFLLDATWSVVRFSSHELVSLDFSDYSNSERFLVTLPLGALQVGILF